MDIKAEWARCRPWIEAALAHDGGFYEIGDIEQKIAEGDAQFWPGRNAAGVTQIRAYPAFKALVYWAIGGDLAELLNDMQPAVEAWAKAQGCTRAMGYGRKGWAPILARHGFEPLWTAYSKELR